MVQGWGQPAPLTPPAPSDVCLRMDNPSELILVGWGRAWTCPALVSAKPVSRQVVAVWDRQQGLVLPLQRPGGGKAPTLAEAGGASG